MNRGLLFEIKIAELLRLLLFSLGIVAVVEVGGGFTNGIDIKIRGSDNCRINIECKLNTKAIGGQVALDISPGSGKIRGVSKRSRSSKALRMFVNDLLIQNHLIDRNKSEITNQSIYVKENPTKLHYQEKMNTSPNVTNIIIIGNEAHLLDEYSPVYRKIRFRKKGKGITAIIENGYNKIEGMSIDKVVRRLVL